MKHLALPLLITLLAGCASGVHMTEAEAEACRARGCTAWTAEDLRALAQLAFNKGMREGARLAQQGRGI